MKQPCSSVVEILESCSIWSTVSPRVLLRCNAPTKHECSAVSKSVVQQECGEKLCNVSIIGMSVVLLNLDYKSLIKAFSLSLSLSLNLENVGECCKAH